MFKQMHFQPAHCCLCAGWSVGFSANQERWNALKTFRHYTPSGLQF